MARLRYARRVNRLWPAAGTIDRLPDEAAALRAVEGRLAEHLEGKGFREVVVPLLERDGVWSASDAVRFVDRHGEVLGLRPDFTGPVARLVATRLEPVADVRVSYRGTVFRDVDTRSGERRQRQQVGFERFAAGDVAEELEVIATARAALLAVDGGLGITIGLGSAVVVEALLPGASDDVRQALDRRDREALPEVLRPLLDLHGGAAVLDDARRLLPASTHAALDRLATLALALGDGGRVVVDLAEVRPWTWYTGVVFSLTVAGAPRPVCVGGRYDGLTGRFGRARPAVGATFDVDALLERGPAPSGPLRVALPKGRLQKEVLARLGRAGPAPKALSSRALVLDGQDGRLQFFLVKDGDVAAYVERGTADVGVVGFDVLREGGGDVLEPLALGFGRCRMCVCGRPGTSLRALSTTRTVRVASKYAHTTATALALRGIPCEVVALKGSVELAVVTGLADVIVDIVETGETLRQNGLVELEELFASTARAIVNRAAFRGRHDEVRQFLSLLQGP